MLQAISRISNLVSAEVAGRHLTKAIQHRLTNWRKVQRNTKLATTTDFCFVQNQVTQIVKDAATAAAVAAALAGTSTMAGSGATIQESTTENSFYPRVEDQSHKRKRVDTPSDCAKSGHTNSKGCSNCGCYGGCHGRNINYGWIRSYHMGFYHRKFVRPPGRRLIT